MRDNILNSLTIMWKGMLAILIAITVIIVAVAILNSITRKVKEKKDALILEKDIEEDKSDKEIPLQK